MIRAYRRAATRCRSVNQLNALHIALDNRMTPAEAWALREALQGAGGWGGALGFWPTKLMARASMRWPGLLERFGSGARHAYEQRRWARRLGDLLDRSGKARAEPFRRQRVHAGVALYCSDGPPAERTMLLCFTGLSMRPMMPTPVFLQHVEATTTDVVVVRYPRSGGYAGGLPGLGIDFAASIRHLADRVGLDRYARTLAVGTSAGGLAALLAATELALDGALVAGALSPDDPRWRAALGCSVTERLRRSARSGAVPQVTLLHGAGHAVDAASAAAIADVLPCTRVAVTDPAGPVGHNPLVPLLMRGELARVLHEATRLPR